MCNNKTTKTTTVTEQNYGLAETQMVFAEYCNKIRKATGSATGTGVFMHIKQAMSPLDRTVVRPNFDTLYSAAVVDLSTDAELIMPKSETGRYQTAWLVSEEHYNPFCCDKPGSYKLTEENIGTPNCMIIVRTQVNVADREDMADAHQMQQQLQLIQSSTGAYSASHEWDTAEVLRMRAKYEQATKDDGVSCDVMFGPKGADYLTLHTHNCGVAYGWGGLTKEQAVYPQILPADTSGTTGYKLRLKDVPVGAFWSVTVYDDEGFVCTEDNAVYNINSAFATPDDDDAGSFTIMFGGDRDAPNTMSIMAGWNITLRLYQPGASYFDGSWAVPELEQC